MLIYRVFRKSIDTFIGVIIGTNLMKNCHRKGGLMPLIESQKTDLEVTVIVSRKIKNAMKMQRYVPYFV